MRKDINIDIDSRDIQFKYSPIPSEPNTFCWISNPSGLKRYLYGEITVSSRLSSKDVLGQGLVVHIPYTPIYKEMQVRFKRVFLEGHSDYIQNPKTGDVWFTVCIEGVNNKPLFASQLYLIDSDSLYLKYNDGDVFVYSGCSSDAEIIPAYNQNTNLLLICAPSNVLRYPTAGVNIQGWLNGNMERSDYLEKFKEEFYKDGVIVNNVIYDEITGKLTLDTNAKSK